MPHTVYLESFHKEIEIEDPSNPQHWLAALKPSCDDFAQQHYQLTFLRDRGNDPDSDTLKKIGLAITCAIDECRQHKDDPDFSQMQWKDYLNGAVGEALMEIGIEEDQGEALHENDFSELYEDLDSAMSDIDGPVCDLDELFEKLQQMTTEKMQELDNTTPMDYITDLDIPFAFSPGLKGEPSIEEKLIYAFSDTEIDSNVVNLLTLVRLKAEDFMEVCNVDYRNGEMLDRWESMFGLEFDYPSVMSPEQVLEMLDNGIGYGELPMWSGTLTAREIGAIDFTQPFILTGGIIGVHNSSSGSGYMEPLEGQLILGPDDNFMSEQGYTAEKTYDFVQSAMRASISNTLPEKTPVITQDKGIESTLSLGL